MCSVECWKYSIFFVRMPGVKRYRVPKIERPSVYRTLCKMERYAPALLSRSRFTPCMSMEGGRSVVGDC